MSAEMFRLIGGQVAIPKNSSMVFELPGTARKTLPGSRGNYILGDNEGQGTMALIGNADEIEAWLDEHADVGIENRSDLEEYGMDDIQVVVSSCEYTDQPAGSKDVRSLNPVGDSIVAIITGVARFSPSPPVVEVIGGITDVVDAVSRKKPKKPDGRTPVKDLQVIFQLAGAGEGTMTAYDLNPGPQPYLGVRFRDLAPAIREGIQKIQQRHAVV